MWRTSATQPPSGARNSISAPPAARAPSVSEPSALQISRTLGGRTFMSGVNAAQTTPSACAEVWRKSWPSHSPFLLFSSPRPFRFATRRKTGFALTHRKQRVALIPVRNKIEGSTFASNRFPGGLFGPPSRFLGGRSFSSGKEPSNAVPTDCAALLRKSHTSHRSRVTCYFSAWRKSSIKSSGSSRPIETRTVPGETPACLSSAADIL